jgi:hypothetical protein
VDVAVDAFGVIITGGFVSAIVAGVVKLAAVRFAHWRFFFTVFFEIIVVSMVTKKGKCCVQCLQTRGLGGQSLGTEGETVIYRVLTVCRGLSAED